MGVPLRSFPSHSLSVPIGLELSLKAAAAQKLHVPPRTRSQLARDIVDFVAQQLPERSIRVLTDGGYATKDFLRDVPESVHVVSRLLVSGTLYELPTPTGQKRRGAPRKKGPAIGSPKTLAHTPQGWQPHPTEAGAAVQAWCGLWHAVLPGHLIRVVVVRRTGPHQAKPGRRTKRPEVEAFFTTDLSLSLADLLQQYQNRWAVEIDIRDANAFYGLGQEQCRKRRRIIGANTFRLVMAAARTLWFIEHVEHTKTLQLGRYRPWYRHKCAPSQLDVVWTCREALQATGILPMPRFSPDLAVNQLAPDRPQQVVA
jgi:hypothetical protein